MVKKKIELNWICIHLIGLTQYFICHVLWNYFCNWVQNYNYNYNTIQVMFLVGAGFMIMLGKERSQILTLKLLLLKCQILIFVKPWSMSDLDVKHVVLFEGLELLANCFEEKCSRWLGKWVLKHWMSIIGYWILYIVYWTFNVSYGILDIEYHTLNIGYWISDVECWILNIKKGILDMWYWKVIQMI